MTELSPGVALREAALEALDAQRELEAGAAEKRAERFRTSAELALQRTFGQSVPGTYAPGGGGPTEWREHVAFDLGDTLELWAFRRDKGIQAFGGLYAWQLTLPCEGQPECKGNGRAVIPTQPITTRRKLGEALEVLTDVLPICPTCANAVAAEVQA